MSLRILSTLNSPPLVAVAGCAVLAGLPFIEAATASGALSLAVLKGANAAAFAVNAASVSVPGRIDEKQDTEMRKGALNPNKPAGATAATPLVGSAEDKKQDQYTEVYSPARGRTLVSPSGWAFAIWGPIYLGEAAFVAGQLFASDATLSAVLPQITAPFVAANIFQSLWCASFRPSYGSTGWQRYVSAGMLAGTAYSLSRVHAVGCSAEAASIAWYFLPMTLHFGWTTAATLVNLNGSVAMNDATSDSAVIAVGNASAVAAAAMGVGVALAQLSPAYGLTVAWALAACADGMKKRKASMPPEATGESNALKKATGVQNALCWAGSLACIAASAAAVAM